MPLTSSYGWYIRSRKSQAEEFDVPSFFSTVFWLSALCWAGCMAGFESKLEAPLTQ